MKAAPKRHVKRGTSAKRTKRTSGSKDATRNALIASGMALFGKQGIDGPSLDDICANAGLTRGAFYVHFEDRDDFLVAVMDRVGASILEELFVPGEGGLAATAMRFVESSATGSYPLMPKGGIRPHQLLNACARLPVLRKRYLALVSSSTSHLEAAVREGQSSGMVRDDVDPANAGMMIMALVVGVQTLADLGLSLPVPALATEVIRVFGKPS